MQVWPELGVVEVGLVEVGVAVVGLVEVGGAVAEVGAAMVATGQIKSVPFPDIATKPL